MFRSLRDAARYAKNKPDTETTFFDRFKCLTSHHHPRTTATLSNIVTEIRTNGDQDVASTSTAEPEEATTESNYSYVRFFKCLLYIYCRKMLANVHQAAMI